MKVAILLIVWLAAIRTASAAPLDLQMESGAPYIISTAVPVGTEAAAVEFFERERPTTAHVRPVEQVFPAGLSILTGFLFLGLCATGARQRFHRARRHALRRSNNRRPMAWI